MGASAMKLEQLMEAPAKWAQDIMTSGTKVSQANISLPVVEMCFMMKIDMKMIKKTILFSYMYFLQGFLPR